MFFIPSVQLLHSCAGVVGRNEGTGVKISLCIFHRNDRRLTPICKPRPTSSHLGRAPLSRTSIGHGHSWLAINSTPWVPFHVNRPHQPITLSFHFLSHLSLLRLPSLSLQDSLFFFTPVALSTIYFSLSLLPTSLEGSIGLREA